MDVRTLNHLSFSPSFVHDDGSRGPEHHSLNLFMLYCILVYVSDGFTVHCGKTLDYCAQWVRERLTLLAIFIYNTVYAVFFPATRHCKALPSLGLPKHPEQLLIFAVVIDFDRVMLQLDNFCSLCQASAQTDTTSVGCYKVCKTHH